MKLVLSTIFLLSTILLSAQINLDLNQKINLKEIFVLLCGMEWSAIAFIIPLRQRIDLAYNKMKKEGFDV
jgi:hypothetical protein